MTRDPQPPERLRTFDELFDTYAPALRRLAARYASTRGEGDDLFQEIVVAVWKAMRAYRGDCSQRTYVFRIAQNRAMSYLARRSSMTQSLDAADELATPAASPEQVMATTDRHRRLAAAVARLPMGHREVVALVLEGLSYRDIADVLGISESNVGARLTRARAELRQVLTEER